MPFTYAAVRVISVMLTFEVYGRVERLLAEKILVHQVQKSVLALVGSAVQHEGEALLEVRVVLDHGFDVVHVVVELAEHHGIRVEFHHGAVLLLHLRPAAVLQFAAFEFGPGAFSTAERTHAETFAEGVDRLAAHAVEAYALLEYRVVELAAGVEDAYGLDHRIERDAAAEIAHLHPVVHDVDEDLLTEPHSVFVDGVVDDFLEEDIYAVSGIVAVTQAAYVHAWTHAHVLHAFQSTYFIVCIIVQIGVLSHLYCFTTLPLRWSFTGFLISER